MKVQVNCNSKPQAKEWPQILAILIGKKLHLIISIADQNLTEVSSYC